MEQKYLVDTNAVIDFCALRLPDKRHRFLSSILDDSPTISVINKIELLSHPVIPNALEIFLSVAHILSLDNDITNETIALRRAHKIKLPDAIIAATAIVNNLTLVTHNTKDFTQITGLSLINLHEL